MFEKYRMIPARYRTSLNYLYDHIGRLRKGTLIRIQVFDIFVIFLFKIIGIGGSTKSESIYSSNDHLFQKSLLSRTFKHSNEKRLMGHNLPIQSTNMSKCNNHILDTLLNGKANPLWICPEEQKRCVWLHKDDLQAE